MTLSPEQLAAMREMGVYNAAYAEAVAEGGAREAIVAILQASEPPSVAAGGMHRMSFGLEYLLEASGNGRERWARLLGVSDGPPTAEGAAMMMETLFIFCDPDGALRALGLHNDLMAFRMAANRHARGVSEETVGGVTTWMVQEMLRYWSLLPFLELAAAVGAAQPAKQDGSQLSSTSSAENTGPHCTPPSGSGAQTLSARCGVQLSSGGEENTQGPAMLTELPRPRRGDIAQGSQAEMPFAMQRPPDHNGRRVDYRPSNVTQSGVSNVTLAGETITKRARVKVCGVDCHQGTPECNGYCTGKASHPPAAD